MASIKWHLVMFADRRQWLSQSEIFIRPKSLEFPVAVRVHGSSDLDVFGQLFLRQELAFLDDLPPPSFLLDLGANVGYFSTCILSKFKQAMALAIEPDPGNAEQCRRNLKPYGARAVVQEGAAWHSTIGLVLLRGTFRDGREWTTQVRAVTHGEESDSQGWDMLTLIEMSPSRVVDLLKVDIEGSEVALFSVGADKWLESIRNICIEFHGKESEDVVINALKDFDYQKSYSGEYALFLNLRRKRQ